MEQTRHKYLKKWDDRVNRYRRRYFFEMVFSNEDNRSFSIKRFGNYILSDIRFVSRQIYATAKQLKVFGPVIRKEYGVPLYIQCYRLLYLTLVVRIRALEFRKRLLFKTESWKSVRQYDYGQIHTQLQLATRSFPDEIPVIEDKFEFYSYCKRNNIQTPEITAVFSNGKLIYPENRSFALHDEDLFVKERMGGKGAGAKKFIFQQGSFTDSGQKKYTKKELLNYLATISHKSDLIVQSRLKNHDAFKSFSSGSLSTCRIVTVKSWNDASILPLFAVLRMPCGNSDVDNYAQGGLLSTIDIQTGILGRAVTYIPYNGRFEFDEHPDTNQKISGVQVPGWNKMLEFTMESHKKFSSLAVGWDVCYTENGIFLIEGNIRWGSTLYESPEQKPFRKSCYPAVYDALMSKYTCDE